MIIVILNTHVLTRLLIYLTFDKIHFGDEFFQLSNNFNCLNIAQ